MACSEDAGCLRVREGRVEQARDRSGPFTTSFAFTGEQRSRLRQRHSGCGATTDDGFRSVALVSRPDGEHAVVAMGTQGVLHRAPGGDWERVPVLDCRPASLAGPSWLLQLAWIGPVALVVAGTVVLLPVRRRGLTGRSLGVQLPWAGLLALLWVGGFVLFSLAGLLMFGGMDYAVTGPLVAAVATVAFLATVVVAHRRAGPPRLGTAGSPGSPGSPGSTGSGGP
jgi:hypothetical protein